MLVGLGLAGMRAFSILERIELGETLNFNSDKGAEASFSILERIELGETQEIIAGNPPIIAFSILERIELGETPLRLAIAAAVHQLSVSSNGSNWVKHDTTLLAECAPCPPFSILERIELGETTRSVSWA